MSRIRNMYLAYLDCSRRMYPGRYKVESQHHKIPRMWLQGHIVADLDDTAGVWRKCAGLKRKRDESRQRSEQSRKQG